MTILKCYLFPKLQTFKDLVRTMSKKPHYRTPLDSLSLKMSLLVICKIFSLFVKRLSPDVKCFPCNSENCCTQFKCNCLKKNYSQFFAPFLKSLSNYKQFEKMTTLIASLLSKSQILKDLVRPISKQPSYKTPFDSHSVKDFYTLAKSVWQHFHHIFSSLW